jgi:hypothetical protein
LNKEFARRFVMAGFVTIVIVDPYLRLNTARKVRRRASHRRWSREKKMRKTILTIAGSALIALASVQLAVASEHHGRTHHRATVGGQFRDTNAYVAAPVVQPAWSDYGYYSHGWSAPAGR